MRKIKIGPDGSIENIILISDTNPPSWAENWPEADENDSIGMVPDGLGGFVMPAPEPPLMEEINQERDRRMHSQFDFNTWTFDNNTAALNRITGAATLAGFAQATGALAGDYLWHGGATPFSWILNDNSVVQIDAPTMFAIGQAAAAWETAHVFAARALKDMDPIPADYQLDTYWP